MAYKYLNPIYGVRRRKRRKLYLVTLATSLTIIAVSSCYQVDLLIRSTMLPSATSIFRIVQTGQFDYRIEIMGEKIYLDLQSANRAKNNLVQIVTTPPACVRIVYQLVYYITGETPNNYSIASGEKLEV